MNISVIIIVSIDLFLTFVCTCTCAVVDTVPCTMYEHFSYDHSFFLTCLCFVSVLLEWLRLLLMPSMG